MEKRSANKYNVVDDDDDDGAFIYNFFFVYM